MFPSYRNKSVDLLFKLTDWSGFYMMGKLVVKGLSGSQIVFNLEPPLKRRWLFYLIETNFILS